METHPRGVCFPIQTLVGAADPTEHDPEQGLMER